MEYGQRLNWIGKANTRIQDGSKCSNLNLPGAVEDLKKEIKVRKGTDVIGVIVLFNKMRRGTELNVVSLAKWVVDYEQSLFFLGPSSKTRQKRR